MATTPKFPDGYNKPTTYKTWSQVLARPKVKMIHPEVLKRVEVMCLDAFNQGVPLGIGGAGRTDQDSLYRSRYRVVPSDLPPCDAGHGKYEGKCWEHYRGAAAAIPGESYHELCQMASGPPFALALDMVGDMTWLTKNCKRYGFRNFDSEKWHIQPIEVPAARRDYNPAKHVLKVMTFPASQPAAPAPPQAPQPDPATIPVPVAPLRLGDKGTDVYLAQVILRHGCKQLTVVPTGVFDRETETAVKNFQTFFKVTVDGKIGPKETWPLLHMVACKAPEVDEDGV